MRAKPAYQTSAPADNGAGAQHLPPAVLDAPPPVPDVPPGCRPVVTLDFGGIGDTVCAVIAAGGRPVRVPPGREAWAALLTDDLVAEVPLRLAEYDRSGRAVPRWEWWAARAGVPPELPAPKPLPAAALEWAVPYAGRVVLCPVAGAANRTWPLAKWLELERRLIELGLSVVVIGEAGRDLGAFRSDRLVGESPARVAAVIHYAACFVGNDSGMAHVAGWLRTPAVAICSHASDHRIFAIYPTVRELGGERWAGFARVDPWQVVENVRQQIRAAAGDFPFDAFRAVLSDYDRALPYTAEPAHLLTTYPTLWRLMRRLRPRRVVEIGSRAGYSAWTILAACPAATVEAFDADVGEHGGYVGAHAHARAINPDRYTLTIRDSHTIDKLPPCDLAYVDGDHTEEGCYADLLLAERSGVPLVLVDDVALLPPVKAAADRFCAERGLTPEFVPNRTGHYLIDLAGRVLVLSAATPGYDPGGLVAANHRRFAELTGHRQEFHTASFDPDRPAAWSKLKFLLAALDRSPWVFWLDADAVFLKAADLSAFTDPAADLILTADHNGINTGAMLVRSSDWSRAFLRRVWEMGAEEPWASHPWWEQAPINHLVLTDDEVRAHVRIVPTRTFNSQPAAGHGESLYQDGDLVAHFPGCARERKAELIRQYAGRL